jgi:hypothetical protein
MVAASGFLNVLSSCFTIACGEARSTTTILEELKQSSVCPFAEKENWKASPWGKAVEEPVEMEMSLMRVLRGRRNTSNTLRLTSQANLRLRS